MACENQLIYFDNAATTMVKPETVTKAVCDAIETFGGVGRGVHGPALAASMAVFEARERVAHLLG
ncbi:MAG: aminotransferase class V-fold PLP-dependent enzyme, partial [Raoultibacter sp.]